MAVRGTKVKAERCSFKECDRIRKKEVTSFRKVQNACTEISQCELKTDA
jgi:hypothetical protein